MPNARAPRSKKAEPKASIKPAPAKRTASKRPAGGKATKDPAGGLTAAGRRHFAETEGSHLRPGVTGPADTPQKKVRKGSFLRRHFANPQGPMVNADGEPTRLALSAHAWGEPVPHTPADAKRLAGKGKQLLAEYHAGQAQGRRQAEEGRSQGEVIVPASSPSNRR